tara:strand:+ start:1955 stop:2197 length:243 start_codon:yes stop_codon:yes gene_type:complete
VPLTLNGRITLSSQGLHSLQGGRQLLKSAIGITLKDASQPNTLAMPLNRSNVYWKAYSRQVKVFRYVLQFKTDPISTSVT